MMINIIEQIAGDRMQRDPILTGRLSQSLKNQFPKGWWQDVSTSGAEREEPANNLWGTNGG